MRATAFATGTVVASAALIRAAPVPQPSVPDVVPVVQVHDVALNSVGLDSGFDLIQFETGVVQVLLGLANITGLGNQTPSAVLDDFGLGSLTPNELLNFTGLGGVTVGELGQFADLFGLGANPVSVLLASLGLSDATNLSDFANQVGLDSQPLSDLYDLVGLSSGSTLSETATALGIGGLPVSNLYGLLGLTEDSTVQEAVNALGIGDTPVDDLLDDWNVGGQDIGGFLDQLGVSPQEVFNVLNINPDDLPSDIYDSDTGTFADGVTVEQFADTAGLGQGTVDDLLNAGDFDNVTVNDLVTGIGLQPDATVDAVLDKIGFNDLSLGDFASGFGLTNDSTVGDLFTNIPGFDQTTVGELLGAFGLSDQSTVDDLLNTVTGINGTTLNGLVTDLGVGDDSLSDLSSTFLGSDTTLDQYLTNILDALVAA
jgi:hypothetical protein